MGNSKQKHGLRRRSLIGAQKTALIISVVLALLLILGSVLVYVLYVSKNVYTDVDGEKYEIRPVGGQYVLTDRSGKVMDVTKDGYYVTAKASTLLEIDKDTGDYKVVALVDTEEGESLGTSMRLLMYNHTSQDNMQSIEISNNYGNYVFYRDSEDKFQIKGYEGVQYYPTVFSSFAVCCGYTLTTMKIEDPIKDADGKYTEYGLAPEKRVNEDGEEYDYKPIWYRLTDTSGNSYTVYVGDEVPDGSGYYVKYTQRDAVYIMAYSVDSNILSMYDPTHPIPSIQNVLDLPIESFVSPVVCYPMQMNDYFNVREFTIIDGDELDKADADENYVARPRVCFSFWDMDERFGTFYHSRAYQLIWPENYIANSNNTDAALQSLYQLAPKRTVKLGIDDDTLKEYGLDDPMCVIRYIFDGGDSSNKLDLEQIILVSEMTPDGTYYLTSALYDIIVEVDASQMLFLDYQLIDWVDSSYFDMNIAWTKEITVETATDTYTFRFDNSQSDSMSNPTYSDKAKENTTISSDKMFMTGEDSKGRSFNGFASYSITDTSGFTWTITKDKVTAVDSSGNKATIKGAKMSRNSLGDDVVVLVGNIPGADGTKVAVNSDTILVTDPSGKTTEYSRIAMSIFRKFYQSLLYASIEGDVHDGIFGLTDEQIKAYTDEPDKNCQVKITVKTTFSGFPEYVFRYYAYSERRSMLTVNGGSGEFCVLRSFTDKIIADAERVMAGEAVDPTSKY